MQAIERRIAALEQAGPPADGLTIIRRFVSPGHLDAEVDHIRDDDGNEWMRESGESETAFTERAASQTHANKWGIKSLIALNMKPNHASH